MRSLLPQNKLEMNFYQVLGNFYTYIIYLGGTFSNSSLCYSGKYIFSHFAEKRDENERIVVVIPGFGDSMAGNGLGELFKNLQFGMCIPNSCSGYEVFDGLE